MTKIKTTTDTYIGIGESPIFYYKEQINLWVMRVLKLKQRLIKFLGMLQKESKIGLTYGQILATLTVLASLATVWLNLNLRIEQNRSMTEALRQEVLLRIESLERGREQNASNIETIRRENREDHKEIMEKLDKLITRK